MGKPIEQRTWKRQVLSERRNMTDAQVSAAKNARTRERNIARSEAAVARHATYGLKRRSPAQQLLELDNRLGKGVGAKRERLRLNKLIEGA